MSGLPELLCPMCGTSMAAGQAQCSYCGEVRDLGPTRDKLVDIQYEVNSLLRRGVVFSIFWLAGFGSIYAVLCGYRARRLIRDNGYPISGMVRVWWCFIIGGTGICFCLPVVAGLIWDVIRK